MATIDIDKPKPTIQELTYFIPDENHDDKVREVKATRRIERTVLGSISVIDFSPEGEELFNELYCGHCWDHGFKSPLHLKILQPGETPDLQCHQCGKIINVFEGMQKIKIQQEGW